MICMLDLAPDGCKGQRGAHSCPQTAKYGAVGPGANALVWALKGERCQAGSPPFPSSAQIFWAGGGRVAVRWLSGLRSHHEGRPQGRSQSRTSRDAGLANTSQVFGLDEDAATFAEGALAARLRTTAFPEPVCGTSAATASFIGHGPQCEGAHRPRQPRRCQGRTFTQV
jgi:hypothetical protein